MQRQEFLDNVLSVVDVLEHPTISHVDFPLGVPVKGGGSLETETSLLAALIFNSSMGTEAHLYSVLKDPEARIVMQAFTTNTRHRAALPLEDMRLCHNRYELKGIRIPGFGEVCTLFVPSYPYGTAVNHKTLTVQKTA